MWHDHHHTFFQSGIDGANNFPAHESKENKFVDKLPHICNFDAKYII
jgi:hypothetical protein